MEKNLIGPPNGLESISGGNPDYWISHERRLISFHAVQGFQHIRSGDPGDHWKNIFQYIEEGYRVQ